MFNLEAIFAMDAFDPLTVDELKLQVGHILMVCPEMIRAQTPSATTASFQDAMHKFSIVTSGLAGDR